MSASVIVTLAGLMFAGCQAWFGGAVGGVSTSVHTEPNGTWSVTIAAGAPAVVDHVFGTGVTSFPANVQEYVPENELALSPFDPALRLPLPEGIEVILSDRDRAAPSLEQARSLGLLPDYRRCRELTAKFRQEPVSSR